jgi:hypothetical protein
MAGAIVNPRMLTVSHPNARLRNRQRIIRGRMGNVTPPPIITAPVDPGPMPGPQAVPERPADAMPAEPDTAPDDQAAPLPEASPAPPDRAVPAPQPFPGAGQP